MNRIDYDYFRLICDVLEGNEKETRNSVTRSINTASITITKPPLISVRKTAWKNALLEFEWFMSGSTNIKDLDPKVRHWWKPWANKEGEIKHGYGKQLTRFTGENHNTRYPDDLDTDSTHQIFNSLELLKTDPNSRRNVITTWNAHDMLDAPITNCHGTVIQFFVNPDKTVDMTMYQRSVDVIVGLPHNLIQYWAFLQYMSKKAGLTPNRFTWIGGDCHIYKEHFELANEIKKEFSNNFDQSILTEQSIEMDYLDRYSNFKAKDFILIGDYNPIINKKATLVV